ncbi:MAG: hypothetical protein ABI145_14905 [Steroidobacteraceae bacterium]
MHEAPTDFASRFTADAKDFASVAVADSVGASLAACAAITGITSRHPNATRLMALRFRTRATSVVVMLVMLVMLALSVPMLVLVLFTPVVALALFPTAPLNFTFTLMIPIVTLVLWIVFLRSHEVHRPIAGIVFMTVLAPILCVPWRNVQIDRRWRSVLRLDYYGLSVYDWWRSVIPDINLTIDSRDYLPRQHDAHVQRVCMTGTDAGKQNRGG